ncbi:MAG: hypothetical protein NTY68_04865, partial [Candidatus Micrarchaeota archaeon]|nr:hypothetical protein [Candidatus Micrarchaeota archaeon]
LQLKARAVAGVANCVLEDEKRDDILLMKKGILFAPDFVLNAGGVIQGIEEYRGSGLQNSTGKAIKGIEEYRKRGLMQDAVNRLPEISKNLREVFSRAKRKRMGTMAAAKYIARKKREIVMGRLMS